MGHAIFVTRDHTGVSLSVDIANCIRAAHVPNLLGDMAVSWLHICSSCRHESILGNNGYRVPKEQRGRNVILSFFSFFSFFLFFPLGRRGVGNPGNVTNAY